MKTQFIFNLATSCLSSALLFYGCGNRSERDTQAANDFQQTEMVSQDVENAADAVANGVLLFKTSQTANILATCATVTYDTVDKLNADTINIDFGTSNCQGRDGRYRRGMVVIVQFGDKFTAGSYRTITFNNFYINDYLVEGTHTVSAKGQNSNGNWNWDIIGNDMKVTNPEGKWHTWNSSRNREMIDGYDTPQDFADNVYLITGSATGENSNGKKYSATITNPLRRELGCKWIVSGTVKIDPSGRAARTLDFGNGVCDDQATVTIRKKTYDITLH